jgi:hypothetical protein
VLIWWYGPVCGQYSACSYPHGNEPPYDSFWYDTAAQWVAAGTGVAVAIFTFITILLVRQALAADNAALDQARLQTGHAQTAATAAERQARIAQQALFIQTKPWLNVNLSGDFVENMEEFDVGRAEEKPAYARMSAHIMIENISQWPARVTSVTVTMNGDYDHITIEGIFHLKSLEKIWVERVASYGTISYRQSSIPVFLGRTDRAINDAQWAWFQRNLPNISVIVRYQSGVGVEYESGFQFKPDHVFGGNYTRVGGNNANYDRDVSQD